jgi:putative peptidoglycan lipid II flippase
VSILAYALSTVLFPYLSESFAQRDPTRSAYLLERGITASLLLAVLAAIICWVYSVPLVTVVFRRGEFNRQSVEYTAWLLKYSALGLAGQFLIWIMSRAFYAAGRNLLFLGLAALMMAVKIGAAAVMVSSFGFIGLAASTSLSYTVGAFLAVIVASVYITRIDGRAVLLYVIKVAAAGAAAWGTAWGVARLMAGDGRGGFGASITVLAVGATATLLVFGAAAYLLNVPEVRALPKWLVEKRRNHGLDG